MKNKSLFNTIVKITLLSLVLAMSLFQFQILPAKALTPIAWKDTLSRLKVNTSADHEIAIFTASGATEDSDTITIKFDTTSNDGTNKKEFDLGLIDYTDMDMKWIAGAYGPCAAGTDVPLAADPAADTWGASVDTIFDTITLTPPSSGSNYIPAASLICIEIGFNATYGVGGDAQILNPSAAQDDTVIDVAGDFGDTGSMAVSIVSDDRITIPATVSPTFTFTISSDSCTLGTLTPSAVATCPYTLAVGTNADNGAVITIQAISDGTNANLNKDGAAGTDINNIAENGTVTLGTEGYGIALTAGSGWTEVGDFNDDDTPIPSSVTDILSTAGPIASSVTSTVTHRAAVSAATEAGAYSQTIRYIATGTF